MKVCLLWSCSPLPFILTRKNINFWKTSIQVTKIYSLGISEIPGKWRLTWCCAVTVRKLHYRLVKYEKPIEGKSKMSEWRGKAISKINNVVGEEDYKFFSFKNKPTLEEYVGSRKQLLDQYNPVLQPHSHILISLSYNRFKLYTLTKRLSLLCQLWVVKHWIGMSAEIVVYFWFKTLKTQLVPSNQLKLTSVWVGGLVHMVPRVPFQHQ